MAKTVLGILGGGQLGRMSAQAARELDIPTVVLTPEINSPAGQVADETVLASYEDQAALANFAHKVDVITYEFENIPVETVRFLKKLRPVFPDDNLLEISQDRIREKTYLNKIGVETTAWHPVSSFGDLRTASEKFPSGFILKTTRFGYDGKGQMRITSDTEIRDAWERFKEQPLIAEKIVDFECEISVIIARDGRGEMVVYGPQLNEHKNHILHRTAYPAPLPASVKEKALGFTETLAVAVSLRGVLCLEMFVTRGGGVLANEIAPRTHNSGHWTIEGCAASQFENHVRAVCGLPLAAPSCRPAEMINLIGEDIHNLEAYEKDKKACIHFYGKQDVRPGRKMGHVTILHDE